MPAGIVSEKKSLSPAVRRYAADTRPLTAIAAKSLAVATVLFDSTSVRAAPPPPVPGTRPCRPAGASRAAPAGSAGECRGARPAASAVTAGAPRAGARAAPFARAAAAPG